MSIMLDANAPDGFIVNSFAEDNPILCRDFIRQKLGLPAFKPNGSGRRRRTTDDLIKRTLVAIAVQSRNEKPTFKIVATYNYTDENGALLYQICRLEPKSEGFRHRRPDGNGGWIWKKADRRVLYRLPEIIKYPDATVFVCEGEKDADRVGGLGLCSTTVASGEWPQDCIVALTGRDVVILQDNDEAGRIKSLAAAQALHGTAKTIRVVLLPGLPDEGDVSDWLDADPHRDVEKLSTVCFDAPLWGPTSESVAAAVTAATETITESKPLPLPFINIAAWRDQPVPERMWTVKDRIPASNVTLLSGEGSVGKSILSLHLATAVVLGRDWLGTLPDMGAALVVCCEDDESELWRRLDLIFQHYGATCTEFKDLHLISLAGQEALLAAPNSNGLIQPTQLFGRINKAACDIKPKLIVLDNSADVYGGSENDRAQVRQFIGLLRGMAIASGAGILLTSHPSLTGINTGTGLSGSTAWNASVRSRLYFKRATTDKDEEPDSDLRVLEVMKSNYGPTGETINLRWKDGLFAPVGGVTNLEKLAANQATDLVFMDLLARFNRQGRNVSDKLNASNYAPAVFAGQPEAKAAGISKSALVAAMERLFAADKIHVETYGRPSRLYSKLVIGGSK